MRAKLKTHFSERGSSLLEALLAILIFSLGLLGLLMLLSATLVQSANARYRSEASLLASDLVAQMWTGDRSYTSLNARFGDTASNDYQRWLASVTERLPGVSKAANAPQVTINSSRHVSVSLQWQSPADQTSHQLLVHALITD